MRRMLQDTTQDRSRGLCVCRLTTATSTVVVGGRAPLKSSTVMLHPAIPMLSTSTSWSMYRTATWLTAPTTCQIRTTSVSHTLNRFRIQMYIFIVRKIKALFRCKSFAVHKLVWWHFRVGWVSKLQCVFSWGNVNNQKIVWVMLSKMTFLDFLEVKWTNV